MRLFLLIFVTLLATSFSPVYENTGACKLRLLYLKCGSTEDSWGSDEAYLVVGGTRFRTMDMSSGSRTNLGNVALIDFYDSITIRLFDEDDGPYDSFDSDDLLGDWMIYCYESQKGTKTAIFDLDDAYYELTYEVY